MLRPFGRTNTTKERDTRFAPLSYTDLKSALRRSASTDAQLSSARRRHASGLYLACSSVLVYRRVSSYEIETRASWLDVDCWVGMFVWASSPCSFTKLLG